MARGEDVKGKGKAARFAAFISYSHADAAIAAKLQRKLERYRLPKHIVEAHDRTAAGLGQIFRDREDLAAAASLSDAIRSAIANAEALIVICSPDAKASEWVSAEIALFRELHPDRPVLAAIVRGEPAEAFPTALTKDGREPLAADLRPGGDGSSLGFLKIVAGIAGVPLDTLVQRDAQRRIRTVTWITLAALTAMLIMGIMTTLAFSARNEAARQRASAEGLVEYMLTDLREKLKGVGRLEVMDAVNERAMEHYKQQGDLKNLSADSLERRARVLHAMGEDYEKQGELDKASVKFHEAYRTTATLLKSNPDDPETVFSHAQSEYWVGRTSQLKGHWNEAEPHYRSYQTLAKKLAKIDTNRKRAELELGHAEVNLGILAMSSRNDPTGARTHFIAAKNAYDVAASMGQESDQQIYFRSNVAAWLADSHYTDGDFTASLSQRRTELALNLRVAERDPSDAEASYLVAKTQLALGKNLIRNDSNSEAEQVLDSAKTRMAKLVSLDGSNDEWAYMYFRMVSNLAIAAANNEHRANADANLAETMRFASRYRNENPEIYKKMRDGIVATQNATGLR
jgi:MTH538 TIR-like domain (DUF1863)